MVFDLSFKLIRIRIFRSRLSHELNRIKYWEKHLNECWDHERLPVLVRTTVNFLEFGTILRRLPPSISSILNECCSIDLCPGEATWAIGWIYHYYYRIGRDLSSVNFERNIWFQIRFNHFLTSVQLRVEHWLIRNRMLFLLLSWVESNHFLGKPLELWVKVIQLLWKPLESWVESLQNFREVSWFDSNEIESYPGLVTH